MSYLLVYVGAVSILFLFILMLINVRISELSTDNSNSIPLAFTIGILFNTILYKLLPSNLDTSLNSYLYLGSTGKSSDLSTNLGLHGIGKNVNNIDLNDNSLSFVTSPIWDGALAETSHITSIGNILYTSYPLWLIITSIILLLAMVGAIVITIKQK